MKFENKLVRGLERTGSDKENATNRNLFRLFVWKLPQFKNNVSLLLALHPVLEQWTKNPSF
jgi:hypothetical protein